MARQETCPGCGGQRDQEHPLCRNCNGDFRARVEKAERNGDVVLVTRMEFAKAKGVETLAWLREELASAQKEKEDFFPKARELAIRELKAGGAFTVSRQELNRKVGKKFGELLGNPDRTNEIWDTINNHPGRIASLENFLVQESDPESQEGDSGPLDSEEEMAVA